MSREIYIRSIAPHNDRVRIDGGAPSDNVQAAILLARDNAELGSNLKLFIAPEITGYKARTVAPYNYASKCYSMDGSNDSAQTTANSQPYIDKIAPVEPISLKNVYGDSRIISHPTITFNANEKWTVETVLKYTGYYTYSQFYLSSNSNRYFYLKTVNGDRLQVLLNGTYLFAANSVRPIIGKISVITFIADGTGNLRGYVNGIEIALTSAGTDTSVTFSNIVTGCSAQIYSHMICSQALSSERVAYRAALSKSIFPEIPNVLIGTQAWDVRNFDSVLTPMGNNIPEIQIASNTEKMPSLNFTNTWTIAGNATIVNSNNFSTIGVGGVIYNSLMTIGKWYKIVIAGTVSTSMLICTNGSLVGFSVSGTFNTTYYINWQTTTGLYLRLGDTGSANITSLSVQEVGWSDSQNLYDWVYAGTSGTTEQKTYAAVKAAAMWCHYNNDVANGAIYGKLYNWFAVKLLQMDIDYYNAANPTASWGWRVPTSTDFTTLSNYLGGDSVSGGKLKMIGTNYWTTPNTGADNSSGFSALSSGFRYEDGVFQSGYTSFATTNVASSTQFTLRQLIYNTATFNQSYQFNVRGVSLRLIKA